MVWQFLAQTACGLLAIALVSISLYDGSLADPRGVPPIELNLFGKSMVFPRPVSTRSIRWPL